MDEKTERMVEALRRYFDRADPIDDDFNARLIREDLNRYDGQLLILGPAVIIDDLRRTVSVQVQQQMFLGSDEDSLDRQLQKHGLKFLMQYTSLVKAADLAGVMALTSLLPLLLNRGEEDTAAINAYAMGVLARSPSQSIASAVKSAISLFDDLFKLADSTACKIALAYALFQSGNSELFKSYAVPRLAKPEKRRMLEQLLTPGSRELQAWVVGMLIMDIASNGTVYSPEEGWQRKRYR